jgi:CPA1 family monovalent cation:H+ antiporter
MNPFDVAAILIAIAAVAGCVNHRVLRLPATSGTLAVALLSSFVVAAEAVFPGVRGDIAGFPGRIDFNETLMHGMLCFLLLAGALHVDLEGLLEHKWTIGALSTVGVGLASANSLRARVRVSETESRLPAG